MEKTNFLLLNIIDFDTEYKTPYLHETWNWEGDESVLPYKWFDLMKKANISYDQEKIKTNYYTNDKFDRSSFFFITHRSNVCGCIYLNSANDKYLIEYAIINNKYLGKGIEEALFSLALNRSKEINLYDKVYLDLSTCNINKEIIYKLKFK